MTVSPTKEPSTAEVIFSAVGHKFWLGIVITISLNARSIDNLKYCKCKFIRTSIIPSLFVFELVMIKFKGIPKYSMGVNETYGRGSKVSKNFSTANISA